MAMVGIFTYPKKNFLDKVSLLTNGEKRILMTLMNFVTLILNM